MGSVNSSASPANSSSRLAGAPGDVEEHGVGERFVHVAQTAGEQAHDGPQQLGPLFVERPNRLVGHGHYDRLFERPCFGRTTERVEQWHLAEEITALHEGDHRFSAIDRLVRDGNATTGHDVEIIGGVVLFEQLVASAQAMFGGAVAEPLQRR